MILKTIANFAVAISMAYGSPLEKDAPLFIHSVDNLPNSRPLCRTLKEKTESLIGFSSQSLLSLKNTQDMNKAIEILESFPSITKQTLNLYQHFLEKDEINQKELGRFYQLMVQNCWKTTELKLWKALSHFFSRASLNDRKKIKRLYKSEYLESSVEPISIIHTMIRIVILQMGASRGLVELKPEALAHLKEIRDKAKKQARILSQNFQEIHGHYGSDWEESLISKEDVARYFAEIKKEAQLIVRINQELDGWINDFIIR